MLDVQLPLRLDAEVREQRVDDDAHAHAEELPVRVMHDELALAGLVTVGQHEALRPAQAPQLAGKPMLDAPNPIADTPPVDGVLRYFTSHDESLMERLQREFAQAHFVKAFNSVGAAGMVNPQLAGGRPTMFICGNDAAAKATATTLLDQLGWEVADMGQVEAARAIEPLCMLWCIPGFLRNDWAHAFKLLAPR